MKNRLFSISPERVRLIFSKGRAIFIAFLTIFTAFKAHSQINYLQEVNQELRHIFSPLTYPDSDVKFLYERSAKMSDSTFYQNNSPDTNNVFVWNLLYDEMYNSAHDTTWLQTVEEVESYPHQFSGDTIVIGVMDYDFYYLLPGVLNSGNYFNFDVSGNQLFDHPNPISSPYGRSNIFAAAALKTESYFSNPVFRIDPNMFFTDYANAPIYTDPQALRIDFGDGTGWHYFDITTTSHYEAMYAEEGQVTIRVEVFDWLLDRSIKGSNCDIMVLKNTVMIPADEYIDLPGLNVGAYYPCENLEPENRKVVIYIEGFDPLDFIPSQNNTIEKNYDKMIGGADKYIAELQNFNYSFYVVDFEQSTLDLRINSMHILNLIEYLKNKYAYSDEQFVVIGHSMGGVIGRYVLTYMESEYYFNADYSPFMTEIYDPQNLTYLLNLEENGMSFNEIGSMNRNDELAAQMHKVRTLITLDSPHQGASIPLSYQQLYEKVVHLLPGANMISYAFNLLLDSKASKQLLVNHIDATPAALIPSSTGNYALYQTHPARQTFMNELQELGNYPQFCKLVAYSSADMGGLNQSTFYDKNIRRTPNDAFADLEVHTKARILYIPVSLAAIQFKMLSNPNGTGLIFQASIGRYINIPQLYWFGVTINSTFVPVIQDAQYAVNAKPYCTSAAGYYDPEVSLVSDNPSSSQFNLSSIGLFNLYSHDFTVDNGCTNLAAHVGWNGFASINFDFSLCSKGTHFGFVSLQSALDYGNGLNLPLNHNIQAENINTKLSRTPFDLIIGYTDSYNHNHSREYYDPLIYNLTGQPATICGPLEPSIQDAENYAYVYYNADINSVSQDENYCEVKRSLLCLEIGDEEMYLENWTLNRPAKFSAQYDIYVNERNPYYQYLSTLPPNNSDYFGIYSKESPFLINTNGFADFVFDATNTPTGIGFVYNQDVNENGFWSEEDVSMEVCLENYAHGRNGVVETDESLDLSALHILLYPNPSYGEVMMLEYDFQDDSQVQLEVFDLSGKKVYGLQDLPGGFNKIRLHLTDLESGLYLVYLHNSSKSETIRLIKH